MTIHRLLISIQNTDKASQSWIGGLGGGWRISHCFHFEFTLSSHWISQRVHFDFTFDLKGKGKASRAEREKGKGLEHLWARSHSAMDTARMHARTKRDDFPVRAFPPTSIGLRIVEGNSQTHPAKDLPIDPFVAMACPFSLEIESEIKVNSLRNPM